ncbi:uncharacterized protein [Dendrobates tinctorius]|uniref:uncharacterized protein isoform X2 n=1 Tax=Dendrobates tinctorius TaxID=92724 RepID=UPI003CCA6BB8
MRSLRISTRHCVLKSQHTKPSSVRNVHTISDPLSGDFLYKSTILIYLSRMDRNRDKIAERLLHLTLEILFRITGEDYTVVKKTSSECRQDPVSKEWGITGSSPHPINNQKILELAYKMIELLTGEGKDLTHINTTETYVRGDERCKAEIPTYDYPGDSTRRSVAPLPFTEFKADNDSVNEDASKEHAVIPCVPPAPHNKNLSCDTLQWLQFSDAPQTVQPNEHLRRDAKHQMAHPEKQSGSSSEHEKLDSNKSSTIVTPQKIHSEEQLYSCPDCQKRFVYKSQFVIHQRTHSGEKPYTCSECGKSCALKSNLVIHQRIHTGEKPYTCSECGKRFAHKSSLVTHKRTHTSETPKSSHS